MKISDEQLAINTTICNEYLERANKRARLRYEKNMDRHEFLAELMIQIDDILFLTPFYEKTITRSSIKYKISEAINRIYQTDEINILCDKNTKKYKSGLHIIGCYFYGGSEYTTTFKYRLDDSEYQCDYKYEYHLMGFFDVEFDYTDRELMYSGEWCTDDLIEMTCKALIKFFEDVAHNWSELNAKGVYVSVENRNLELLFNPKN